MKLKIALVLTCIACMFVASHYNDHISVSVTLPSPAEVVNALGKVGDELKESSNETGIRVAFIENSQDSDLIYPECTQEMYRVSPTWGDYKNQIGAYHELENAIYNCPVGYYVFNDAGEVVYNPNSAD